MKGLTVGLLATSFALGFGARAAGAQTGSVPLGDVARQIKAQLAKSGKKSRVFTNDDLIALRKSRDQSSPSSVSEAATRRRAEQQTSGKQAGQAAARTVQVEWGEATAVDGDYIDQMSKVQVAWQGKDAENSPSAATAGQTPSPARRQVLAAQVTQGERAPDEFPAKANLRAAQATVPAAGKQPAQSPERETRKQARQDVVSAPFGEWAKAKFRDALGIVPQTGEPGPIAAPATITPPAAREDLGYVERADGKVEAIVADGDRVGLVEETKEFAKNFRFPAPTPAELEMALAPPPNPPDFAAPEAAQIAPTTQVENESPAGGEVNAQLLLLQPPIGNNGEALSEASATLQSEPLADYTGDQSRAQPPETLQVPPTSVSPPSTPDDLMTRSTVKPLGYVERAGGEKEAILEFGAEVYLVHEGEVFAGKFRLLRVAPNSVEIVEELTEASSAAATRRRLSFGNPPPDSK